MAVRMGGFLRGRKRLDIERSLRSRHLHRASGHRSTWRTSLRAQPADPVSNPNPKSPFSVWDKTSTPHGSSDRRKFRAHTTERFQPAPEIADTLVPDGLLVQKFSTYNGEPNHPTPLPVLTTPAAVIRVLGGGADLMVPGASRSSCVTPGGRMAVDADKTDNDGVNKGKAVVVLNTWKDHLRPSDPSPGRRMPSRWWRQQQATTVMTLTATGGGADTPRPGADQEPAENAPAVTQDGATEVEEIEKFTPEEVSPRLHAALCKHSEHPHTPKFRVCDAHAYPLHGTHPPCTPILAGCYHPCRHQAFLVQVALCLFARVGEGDLLKLKDARPDVQVAAVFPTHPDVVAHRAHRTVGEEDERRRRAEEREVQQAAEAANAGKTIIVRSCGSRTSARCRCLKTSDSTAPYPLADVKSTFFTYAEKHDLVNRFEQRFNQHQLGRGLLCRAPFVQRQGHLRGTKKTLAPTPPAVAT
ncbi:hypothetical protein EDB89DRAFT_2239699 [Lactarius sanguifluus]|nr:hypothetical protein EDB89DRAFT_2239699 [Lactarius sanguifluus]